MKVKGKLEQRSEYVEIPVHKLIEAQVERTPEAFALVYGESKLTYRDLNNRANVLAVQLQARGVGAESIVGILVKSSLESIIGLLAILKAGGAFLSLASKDPDERLNAIIGSAKLHLIVTEPSFRSRIPSGVDVICLDRAAIEGWNGGAAPNVRSEAGSDNIAFVRYTSGSSGGPKGVVNTHRSITNRLALLPLPDIQGSDLCAVNTSSDFASRLFLPLVLGARIAVLADDTYRDPLQLVRMIDDYRVTSIYMVPSLLRQVLKARRRAGTTLRALRAVTVGGETLTMT